jgi:hypothetical protein
VLLLTICLLTCGCESAFPQTSQQAVSTSTAAENTENNLPFETASAAIVTSTSVITTENVTEQTATHEETTAMPITAAETPPEVTTLSAEDEILMSLFDRQASDVQVSGRGVVTQILADDNEGGRHQRFILALDSGQTLLIAHNIDHAPRLDGLSVGDAVEFYGEYYYTEQGGGIHWTHADPDGSHVAGYLKWDGDTYSSQQIEQTETPQTAATTAAQAHFIGNVNSLTVHAPECGNLPDEKNRIYFSKIEDALNSGYHKHKACLGE